MRHLSHAPQLGQKRISNSFQLFQQLHILILTKRGLNKPNPMMIALQMGIATSAPWSTYMIKTFRARTMSFKYRRATCFFVASMVCMSGAQADPGNAHNRPPAPGSSDKVWLLGKVPEIADNPQTPEKVRLGKALFFDPRLSGNGTISCATCHNPALGWSDGLKTGIGINGALLGRASPTIVNVAYNTQFMWDGRKKSLEDQAMGPMKTPQEMKTDFEAAIHFLGSSAEYAKMFEAAFPGEPVEEATIAKAIASFERTVVSKGSRFDKWAAGRRDAITKQEYQGYQIFKDPERGNCIKCHSGPNFTDNGYHNIGLKPLGDSPDEGRYRIKPIAAMKGAFKTPTLRDIALTAPYFHDGSASTLMEVVEHYARGGDDKSNLSKDIHPLNLSSDDKTALVAFLKALTGQQVAIDIPTLPRSEAAPSQRPASLPPVHKQ